MEKEATEKEGLQAMLEREADGLSSVQIITTIPTKSVEIPLEQRIIEETNRLMALKRGGSLKNNEELAPNRMQLRPRELKNDRKRGNFSRPS